jgi:hypothetical protein
MSLLGFWSEEGVEITEEQIRTGFGENGFLQHCDDCGIVQADCHQQRGWGGF